MAKKIFVLRTNSLVSSEDSTLRFDGDNEVVIPFPIIDELEKLTHQYTEKGRIARKILEYLDSFTIASLLNEGVRQKNGSILRIEKGFKDVEIPLSDLSKFDKRCLQIAKGLKDTNQKVPVILVTKNAGLRLKAKAIGIKAQTFRDDIFPSLDEQYKGRIDCQSTKNNIELFFKNGYMPVKNILKYSKYEWVPNVYLTIHAIDDKNVSTIACYNGKNITRLKFEDYHPFQISAKNAGQKMILEALLEDPEKVPLVIIKGGAGTGKTYASLAVALDRTTETDKIYSEILISSPVDTVGQEKIGFLPGDVESKLNPHLGGLKDNLRLLVNSSGKSKESSNRVEDGSYFFERGIIQIQPIGFLRGRTIVNTIFIIDETQNIDPDDIKSIVSRAGEGSKFIFLGDPTQIDNPNLNERYNGLVYLSEKMKFNPLCRQVTLTDDESVRSKLAKEAAKIL